MKTQIVEQRILIADIGKVLTNGETYGKIIALPSGADYTVWHEIAEEDPPVEDEVENN